MPKPKSETSRRGKRPEQAEDPSKGQYGGLKGLGPGGGRDIEDAAETDDIPRDDSAFPRKRER